VQHRSRRIAERRDSHHPTTRQLPPVVNNADTVSSTTRNLQDIAGGRAAAAALRRAARGNAADPPRDAALTCTGAVMASRSQPGQGNSGPHHLLQCRLIGRTAHLHETAPARRQRRRKRHGKAVVPSAEPRRRQTGAVKDSVFVYPGAVFRLAPEELAAAQDGRDRFGRSEADPADAADGEAESGMDDATASDAADAADADDQEPVREAA